MKASCFRVVLALAASALVGCDDEPDKPSDSEMATQALQQIAQYAPTSLPASAPDELLRVTLGGVPYNLRELLSRPSDSRPSARIVAAYRTLPTPSDPPPLGTSTTTVPPDYTRSAPAAQVYECRQNGSSFAWVLLQPEAGLEPITTQPVSGPAKVSDDS